MPNILNYTNKCPPKPIIYEAAELSGQFLNSTIDIQYQQLRSVREMFVSCNSSTRQFTK